MVRRPGVRQLMGEKDEDEIADGETAGVETAEGEMTGG